MKKIVYSSIMGILMLGLVNCSSLGPKPHVVYHRPDLKNTPNKVIIMPVTDFRGVKSKGAKDIEIAANSGWSGMFGAAQVIPAGPVVEKVNKSMKGDYRKIIQTLDNISAVEQLHKNPNIRKLVSKVTSQLGNHHLAFTVIRGDQASFDSQKDVIVHLGLFDTKNLTWKWITKIQDKKGKIGNWTTSSNTMLSNSFDKAKEVDGAKESMARSPASH